MDSRVLVTPDIAAGQRVVDVLRADKKADLRAALWWYEESADDLRLLLATPLYSSLGPNKTYLHFDAVLSSAGLADFPVERLWPVDPGHEIVKVLRRIVAPTATHVEFRNCTFNALQVPFAHVYFVAKAKAETRKRRTSS